MKLDEFGNIIWVKSFGSGSTLFDVSANMKYRHGALYCSGNYQGHSAIVILDTAFTNPCFHPDSNIVLNKVPEPIYSGPITNTPPTLAYTVGPDSVTVTNGGYSSRQDLCFSVNTFNHENFEVHLNIFPNPTTGKLKVTKEKIKIKRIAVFNLLSKKVLAKNSSDEIDLSSLPSGIYIVEVSGENFIWREKVLKE